MVGHARIVTLAAALALPGGFPYRDLIVLTAFAVVVGTLTIQGLTLKPLLRALKLHDGDPVGHEIAAARERAMRAGLARLEGYPSPQVETVRRQLKRYLAPATTNDAASEARTRHSHLLGDALKAARDAVFTMRAEQEIGDDAFHAVEEELDWLDMANGRNVD